MKNVYSYKETFFLKNQMTHCTCLKKTNRSFYLKKKNVFPVVERGFQLLDRYTLSHTPILSGNAYTLCVLSQYSSLGDKSKKDLFHLNYSI